jgi:hypothetical protein
VPLAAVHPVLACHDVTESTRFFQLLGFTLRFQDDPAKPMYAAMRRDDVELHFQWADAGQWVAGLDRPAYRFLVDDVDALYAQFATVVDPAVFGTGPWKAPADTPWGTREFHLRDPGGNSLQFYR